MSLSLAFEGGTSQVMSLQEDDLGGAKPETAPLLGGRGEGRPWLGRWKRIEITGERRLVSATVDPENRAAIDVNRLNNSLRVEPDGRAAAHWGARWVFWLQQLLATVGL